MISDSGEEEPANDDDSSDKVGDIDDDEFSTLQSSEPEYPISLFNSTFGELSKTEFVSKEAEMAGFVSVTKQGSSVFPCFCEFAKLWQIAWSFASTEEWRGL